MFLFFIGRYYFSENYKKKSYRSLNNINEKINIYSSSLPLLKNNTNNVVEYVENNTSKDNKKYRFWKLIEND